jgi:DNA repair protein RecO (recombination protein O)
MIEKTRAIVLNNINYSDSATIAKIYTEWSGRVSVMVRHSKSRKSVSKKSMLQPLSLIELNINLKPNREIQYASDIFNTHTFSNIPYQIAKSAIAFFIAEVLLKVIKEEEKNQELFEFLFSTICLLDQMEEGTENFHLVFLYELTRFLGFYPSNNFSEKYLYFNLVAGKYIEKADYPEISLDSHHSRLLHTISEKGFKYITGISFTREDRLAMLHHLIRYYQYHLAEMGQLKSFAVLTEVFDSV